MSAENQGEEKSLILSPTRGVTTHSSSLIKRGLNLIESDRKMSPMLKRLKVVFNSLGMAFIRIPAGELLMGDSTSALTGYLPRHCVQISQPFYLGRHLVTQGQWEAVMDDNPSHFKGSPEHPVERVSWEDVQLFLQQLNKLDDLGTYRLATEAEWEYACRAGLATPKSFDEDGDQLKDYAWYGGSMESTQPVGQKLPNAWGLHDMLGNVWEWCHDGGRNDTVETGVEPIGPTEAGAHRAIRGGSWNSPAHSVYERCEFASGARYGHIGFRCLSSVPNSGVA